MAQRRSRERGDHAGEPAASEARSRRARAIIDLERWYQRQWEDGRDCKEDLIELLDASKFGQKEYSPWQVYMKALFEYFRDDLGDEQAAGTRLHEGLPPMAILRQSSKG